MARVLGQPTNLKLNLRLLKCALLLAVTALLAVTTNGHSSPYIRRSTDDITQIRMSRHQQRLLRQVPAQQHTAQLKKSVAASVAKAEAMLNSTREERGRRILVPLLVGSGRTPCCMLENFDANVRSTNPNVDIIVFSLKNAAARDAASCELPNVHYMALQEHWGPKKLGSAARPELWSLPRKKANYRNMGHWRLVFQFAFADMLGYKYVWQLDDDTGFRAKETLNVTEFMQGKLIAGYEMFTDVPDVTWGLPELTRAFLVAEKYIPRGNLYRHTKPPGLQGLYTVKSITKATGLKTGFQVDDSEGGWDRFVMGGNCLVINVQFMQDPLVQRFLELVTASQYHYRFRWNEQAVLAMVWQLFVPAQQSGRLQLRSWVHGYDDRVC